MFFGEKIKKIDWHPKWEPGAPMPQVFSNGLKIYLTYVVFDGWERPPEKFEKLSGGDGYTDYFGLVEFDGGTFRFGIANEEVFSGLQLYKKGLHNAQVVENSGWLKEIKNIHRVHPNFDDEDWDGLNHYLLLFHDDIFEVIARGYVTEVFLATRSALCREVANRMNRS